MQEIKYRGKSKKTGKWLYGYPCKGEFSVLNTVYSYIIIVKNFFCLNSDNFIFIVNDLEVDEDTVSQYTGLKDETGKEIYGWDILANKTTGEIIGWVEGGVRGYCYDVVYVNHPTGEKRWSLFETVEHDYPDNVIVVGNIHDNPELLEETK